MPPLFRIVLTGPECTGKSTLAQWLGQALGFPVSEEAARLLAAERGELQARDVEDVARLQIELEQKAIAEAVQRKVGGVVHDTDLFSTVLYSRYYYGSCPPWIEQAARRRRSELYLLLLPDIPYEPEPGQRAPYDARREQLEGFTRLFEEEGIRPILIGGLGEARNRAAWQAVEEALGSWVSGQTQGRSPRQRR